MLCMASQGHVVLFSSFLDLVTSRARLFLGNSEFFIHSSMRFLVPNPRGLGVLALLLALPFTSTASGSSSSSLKARDVKPGVPVKPGTELRILPLGDSITWGYTSPDGNGYRLQLYNDLSGDNVVFAGVIQSGNMIDNWNGGYPGQTIQYIAGQAPQSLAQHPNIVLFMAGMRTSLCTVGRQL